MKRYFNSFLIASLVYGALFVGFFYTFKEIKKITIKNEKTIALNHISLIQQKEIIKVEKKEPKKKKLVKKKVTRPIQKLKEITTVKSKIKKVRKVKEKVVKKEIIEKKQPQKEQVQLKKTAVKRDYKEEFLLNHLKQIVMLIQKNMKYPRRAKQLSIQGEVLIEFTLTKEGETKNYKTLKGHRLLKKSTVQAIQRASKLFPRVKRDITLIVPVSYTLT